MAQKKPGKIILCKCLYPKVYEIADFKPNSFDDAIAVIEPLNGKLQINRNPEDNFYFLNIRIGKEIKIITKAEQDSSPGNDPVVVDKLQAYLEGQTSLQKGANQKRGRNDMYNDL